MNNFNRSLICIVWFLLLVSGSALQARESTVFFHNDALGSPLAATDEAGKVLWKENYEPFGDRQVKAASANNNKLWFAGKPHDESSGLSYFNARYYSPLLGRFISVDPVDPVVGDVHHFNRYAYAHNNPNKYIDPDGKLPFLIPVAIFLAKELAAEGLSYATNGATDYLSVRRLGTKVAGHIAEKSLAVAVRNGIKDLPGNVAKGPISVDDALGKAASFMKDGVPIKSIDGKTGVLFIQEFSENGQKITKRVGIDVNPNSSHVKQLGPHLNLQTQINGKIQKTGSLADPHIPIDSKTIRSGDY